MASIMKKTLVTQKGHTVGHVNSYTYRTVPNGVLCSEDIDNYVIGEVYFAENVETGETEKQIRNVTGDVNVHDHVLVITPEQRLNVGIINEPLSYFYNGKGERATVVYLEQGLTFQTSAYNGENLAVGDFVVYDKATKKFIKATGEASGLKFRVEEIEEDINYTIDDQTLLMLSVY